MLGFRQPDAPAGIGEGNRQSRPCLAVADDKNVKDRGIRSWTSDFGVEAPGSEHNPENFTDTRVTFAARVDAKESGGMPAALSTGEAVDL